MTTDSSDPGTLHFPPELVDLVVDASRKDTRALASYALVCKQWTPRSRYHLFAQATIFADNARQFVSLLSSPHCTFETAIRELGISLAAGDSHQWLSELSRRLQPMLPKTINLRRLKISGSRNTIIQRVEEGSGAWGALVAFGRQNQSPSQIAALEMGLLTFESLADFVDMLSAFPNLHTLVCAAHFQDASQPELRGGVGLLPQITTIDLAPPSTTHLLEFLLNQGILPTVTTLTLSRLAGGDLSILERFTHSPDNNTLQNLIIKFDSVFSSGVTFDVFAQRVDMTQLHALRHLIVETVPDMPFDPAFTLLSSISSQAFERLEISLLLTEEVSRIDSHLTSEKFPLLKQVTILRATPAQAKQFFPLCAARNLLREA